MSLDLPNYFSDYKNWSPTEKKAIKYANGKCLDIGCGAGRVLLYLKRKSIPALGIDTSPLAIKVCKLRGLTNVRIMGINDISGLKPQIFDSIILFGRNFGLFQDLKTARVLLKMLYGMTSKTGLIIAETRDPYVTKNKIHLAYLHHNKRLNKLPGQQRIRLRYLQYSSGWYDYLYVSKAEMKKVISGSGWKIRRFIESPRFKEVGTYFVILEKINSN